MDRKIIVTDDNSKTLLIPALNETYHSKNGALNESIHVFIDAGFHYFKSPKGLRIFEMGFGTGLNAATTLHEAILSDTTVFYTSIEKYPINQREIDTLNFESLHQLKGIELHQSMHTCAWNEPKIIHPLFKLRKLKGDILEASIPETNFDIIYYDAFGPATQPDLWSHEMMLKMYNLLQPGGILITYCAQGQFKRNLKSAGFTVENLPGPIGKREITRAIKPTF